MNSTDEILGQIEQLETFLNQANEVATLDKKDLKIDPQLMLEHMHSLQKEIADNPDNAFLLLATHTGFCRRISELWLASNDITPANTFEARQEALAARSKLLAVEQDQESAVQELDNQVKKTCSCLVDQQRHILDLKAEFKGLIDAVRELDSLTESSNENLGDMETQRRRFVSLAAAKYLPPDKPTDTAAIERIFDTEHASQLDSLVEQERMAREELARVNAEIATLKDQDAQKDMVAKLDADTHLPQRMNDINKVLDDLKLVLVKVAAPDVEIVDEAATNGLQAKLIKFTTQKWGKTQISIDGQLEILSVEGEHLSLTDVEKADPELLFWRDPRKRLLNLVNALSAETLR